MILDDIVAKRRVDLAAAQQRVGLGELQDSPVYAEPRRPFREALTGPGRNIIAEVKKASPSKGVIREDFDPVMIARRYAECGASAISVLTEEHYFQGSLSFLKAIRAAVPVPLLRKDFLFDPYQIHEARAWGADAILLIVSMLSDTQLVELQEVAQSLGLAALVEVHDEEEWQRAQRAGATLVGVNNRNLKTFQTTLETTEKIAPLAGDGVVLVSESGINWPADLERLEAEGVHSFLIGESLMREPDPGTKLVELLGAPASAARSG